MRSTMVTFPAYAGSATCTFKCLACGREKRKRTFRVEHTVNPWNTNPDGSAKPASQVVKEAHAAAVLERDQFMAYPLCKQCEDARSWSEMKSIRARRKAADTGMNPMEAPTLGDHWTT